MNLMLDTEVVLTEILAADKTREGVTYADIRGYCDAVKNELFLNGGYNTVHFGISKDELARCVKDYPDQFETRDDRYYQGFWYAPNFFKGRNNQKINSILEFAAHKMKTA